jgi:hypothetical protein
VRIELYRTKDGLYSAYGKPTRRGEKRVQLAAETSLDDLQVALVAAKPDLERAKGRPVPA